MKMAAITAAMVMAAGAATTAYAAQRQNATLVAYVVDDRTERRHGLIPAESMARHMFAAAGLDLKWLEGAPAHPPGRSDLAFVVTIVDQTPVEHKPGALACAQVFEGVHLTIYYDRVAALTRTGVDTVLAHVLVHELTHLIQGINRHSDSGVMKPHYTNADIFHMVTRPLPFTETDVVLINLGVAHRLRSAALVANTSAPAGGYLRDVSR
jgi:hypothetical protein